VLDDPDGPLGAGPPGLRLAERVRASLDAVKDEIAIRLNGTTWIVRICKFFRRDQANAPEPHALCDFQSKSGYITHR
jgi:hypothetical protein